LIDPVVDDSVGVFTNEIFKTLYDSLTTVGNASIIEALKVGALIEEIDIRDLVLDLDLHIDNEDIRFVYENLYKGSRNHLRAYVRNLTGQNITYEPKVIDVVDYQAIITSDWERGR